MTTYAIPTRKPRPFNTSAGTHTRDGLIPHLELLWDGGTLHAPVKVNPVNLAVLVAVAAGVVILGCFPALLGGWINGFFAAI